jgi:hypothetical protein
MVYEAKDGQFACFQKKSKAGKIYYSGAVRINDKNFNISIFEKVTVKGDKFLSGIIDECKTQSRQEVKEVKQEDDFTSDFLDDDISF